MSKPVARVVLSVLITVAILAGVYVTVYGAAFSVGASSGRAQVTAGLMPDLSHSRMQASTAATGGYYTGLEESASNKGHGGGCEHESYSSFDD